MKRKLTILILVAILVGLATTVPAQEAAPEPLALDGGMREAIVDSILTALDEVYVFPEVAAQMNELVRRNLADGQYDELTSVSDFAGRLTEDLQSVSHDLHLHVEWSPPRPQRQGEELSDEEMDQLRLERSRRNNFGFREVKLMPGNIAYIKLDGFSHTSQAGPTAIAAMNFVGYADAVIFDLRENGGGSPSMIQLLTSYLVKERTHLNSFYVRHSDETNQFWTHEWVPGPSLAEAPVYVLTSGNTFSAAEEFTYNLKNLERATIVGETTGGGAHPVTRQIYPDYQISLSLPFGRAINPITETNWEGTGIEPHLAVPADQALDVAYLDALKKLADSAEGDQKFSLNWAISGLEATAHPVTLDEKEMKTLVGQFGPRRVWLEEGSMWYERGENGKHRMTPMGENWFLVEGLDFFRIEFQDDGGQEAGKLVGHYNSGHQDQNDRTGP
jgi:hypothetical protein